MNKLLTWFRTRIPFYFLFFVCPVLGMMNCQGWNSGSMAVKSCVVNIGLLQVYANFYYGLLLMSSFALLIPLIIYVVVGVCLSEIFGRNIAK